MLKVRRAEGPTRLIRSAGATGPDPTRFWGQWSIILGVLTFTSGLFLLLMFISLGLGRGAAPWGPINDLLGGLSNLLLAALIPVLSRRAVGLPWERSAVWFLSGASVVAAASGFLLVAGKLGFEQSTAVSVVVIMLQVVWMLWLNRRFLRDPAVPTLVSRFGIAFAVLMLAGTLLLGLSFAAGSGTLTAKVLQVTGGTLGGAAWLSWPAWFILMGRHLKGSTRPPRRA